MLSGTGRGGRWGLRWLDHSLAKLLSSVTVPGKSSPSFGLFAIISEYYLLKYKLDKLKTKYERLVCSVSSRVMGLADNDENTGGSSGWLSCTGRGKSDLFI